MTLMDLWDPHKCATAMGLFDVSGGCVMLWSCLRITTAAGFCTTRARWALFRRFVYLCMAIALFGLGIGRLDGIYTVAPEEGLFQLMLIFGVIIFPVLRAVGWISQDNFWSVGGDTH